MSTKTSLKKIAVIAAMALTLGGFTAISASAVNYVTFTASATVGGSGTSVSPYELQQGSNTGTITAAASGMTSYSATGLPIGLSMAAGTGVISGTPSALGTATPVLVTATNGGSTKTGTVYISVVTTVVAPGTADQPWRALDPAGDFSETTGTVSIAKTTSSVEDYVKINASANTADKTSPVLGNYRYLEVTGSTIFATTTTLGANDEAKGLLNGTQASGTGSTFVPGTATTLYLPLDGLINGDQVWIATPAAGTVTAKFFDRTVDAVTGVTTVTLLQTITITVSAPSALSSQYSTSYIHTDRTADSTTGIAYTECTPVAPAIDCDDAIIAPMAIDTLSASGKAKASIKVTLRGNDGALLNGTRPAIGASIDGPGTLSISTGVNGAASEGRNLSRTVAPVNGSGDFYINVFSDGNSGTGTVTITVGGTVWTKETIKFYGAATALTATQYLSVLMAGGGTSGSCAAAYANCSATAVSNTPAVKVVATDANLVPVPYVSYTVTTSDATVLSKTVSSSSKHSAGATWFTAVSAASATSGQSATNTFTAGTLTATATYKIGGAPASVSVSLGTSPSQEVGAMNSLVFTDKDAAGNPAYDVDVDLDLTSNVALIVGSSGGASNGLPSTIKMIGGTGTVDFYNPLVPAEIKISGTADGVLPVAITFSVSNSAVNAAADAAAEATDAANAATDAANAAAEAADAATAAAQDAADAVAALSAQVTAMISALKKQLIALTNLVIKIQKKVRA